MPLLRTLLGTCNKGCSFLYRWPMSASFLNRFLRTLAEFEEDNDVFFFTSTQEQRKNLNYVSPQGFVRQRWRETWRIVAKQCSSFFFALLYNVNCFHISACYVTYQSLQESTMMWIFSLPCWLFAKPFCCCSRREAVEALTVAHNSNVWVAWYQETIKCCCGERTEPLVEREREREREREERKRER